MKRKLIIITLIILGVSMLSGGVLVVASFFGGSGDINKGLIGHWKFDGTAEDVTPYSNDGTVTEAALTTDRKAQSNKAYNFDGSNDVITVTDNNTLDIGTSDFSLSAWFNLSSGAVGTNEQLLDKRNSSSPYTGYTLYIQNGTDIRFQVNAGAQTDKSITVTSLKDDAWHYIVMTIDRDSATGGKIYLDGTQVGSSQDFSSQTASIANARDFYIGQSHTDSNSNFTGKIDDVRVYNRILSPAEITSLYDSYNPGTAISSLEKGLIIHLPLSLEAAKSDTVTADKTPYSSNGTLTGGQNYTNDSTTDRKAQADKALNFNGTSDYLTNSSSDMDVTAGTLAFWFKQTAAVDQYIFHNKFDTNENVAIRLVGGTAAITFERSNVAYTLNPSVQGAGVWQHIVLTWAGDGAGSDDVIAAYIDGSLSETKSNGNIMVSFNALNYFGSASPGDGLWCNCSMSDIRIYNRVLDATEITRLYDSYNPGIAMSSLSKGLVGYWPLDLEAAKSDTVTADKTPYSNNGTLSGGQTYTNDKTTDRKAQADKALNFNGTTDYVVVSDNATLQDFSDFTFSAWINTSKDYSAEEGGIITKKGSGGNYIFLMVSTANKLFWSYRDDNSTEKAAPGPTDTINDGQWHHVVGVRVLNTYTKMFVDGVEVSTSATGIGTVSISLSGGNLEIGSERVGVADNWFQGSIDDVRIYDRALTAIEITRLYESYF